MSKDNLYVDKMIGNLPDDHPYANPTPLEDVLHEANRVARDLRYLSSDPSSSYGDYAKKFKKLLKLLGQAHSMAYGAAKENARQHVSTLI